MLPEEERIQGMHMKKDIKTTMEKIISKISISDKKNLNGGKK